MRKIKKPNPGSDAALKIGCSCPVLDNSHGAGYLGIKGMFVQSLDCKIHGVIDNNVKEKSS